MVDGCDLAETLGYIGESEHVVRLVRFILYRGWWMISAGDQARKNYKRGVYDTNRVLFRVKSGVFQTEKRLL